MLGDAVSPGWRATVSCSIRCSPSERSLMSNNGKLLAGVIAIGSLSLGASVLPSLPASASTSSVEASPAKGLLATAQAHRLGFNKTVTKPTTSTKTGVTGCGKGAQVVYENTGKKTGLVSEVLVCKSANGAASLIKREKTVGSASSLHAPKTLGSSAVERVSGGTTYAVFWQRGKILELVAFDANIAASTSSAANTPVTPLTATQQQAFAKAVLYQDAAAK